MRLMKLVEQLTENQIRGLLQLKRRLTTKRGLERTRKQLVKQLARTDKKIASLTTIATAKPAKKRRSKVSAAARRKMSLAQKRRWAKIRKPTKARSRKPLKVREAGGAA